VNENNRNNYFPPLLLVRRIGDNKYYSGTHSNKEIYCQKMLKSKKQKPQEYQYDEASSGSDSSDDDNDDEYISTRTNMARGRDEPMGTIDSGKIRNEDEDDDNIDQDDSSNNSDSENEEEDNRSKSNRGSDDVSDAPDDSGDGDDQDDDYDESSSDKEDMPLHERLLKKESRGRSKLMSRREQKSWALAEATKRLAAMKEGRKSQKGKVTDGKGRDDESLKRSPSSKSYTTNTKAKKKKNKHKPTEVSSKRADFFGRGARRLNESGLGVDIGAHRYKPMDPRLSTLSGHFDEDRFQNNYAFLEEIRNREIGQVRKRIAAHKATGNKGNRMRRKHGITQADGSQSSTLEEDVARLKSLAQARADLERRNIDRAAKQSVKRKIREDVESGRSGVYFLKRKEQKRLELEARFEEIRKRKGEKGVEKILEKKRKKNKSRDASFLSR